MIFSGPTEYAIRALTHLAVRSTGAPVLLDEMVAGTTLPREFTAKLLQKLVRAGLLKSFRGRGGGFQLARPSHEIRIIDVVDVLDGTEATHRCVLGMEACNDQMHCGQHDLFKPIRQRLIDYLTTTTLADLEVSLRYKLRQQADGQPVAASAT